MPTYEWLPVFPGGPLHAFERQRSAFGPTYGPVCGVLNGAQPSAVIEDSYGRQICGMCSVRLMRGGAR